jgi:hypothetical protein
LLPCFGSLHTAFAFAAKPHEADGDYEKRVKSEHVENPDSSSPDGHLIECAVVVELFPH